MWERDPLPSRPLMALCSHAHPVRPLASYGDQRIPAPFLHVLGFSSTQHGPNSTEPSAASIFGASTPIFGATAPLSGASATAPDATASLEGGGRLLRSHLPSSKHQILCSYNKKKSAYMRWKQIERVCCLVCCRKLAWSSVLQKRLGCFQLAMEVKKDLRLEKCSQIKESPMGRLGPADMFVQMRHRKEDKRDHLTECPRAETIKGII